MASVSTGDVHRHLRQLFETGSAVGLTDGQLLERFAAKDSGSVELAFETILSRHGSTVWTVCRQVLGDAHAAEDAFQATFLVLVRRAGSLRVREPGSLGPWLYGVAYRTAIKARQGDLRRHRREHRVAVSEARAGQGTTTVERDDIGAALHEEVNRLPSKYRDPVVLCYFEGRTHDEVAAALNWPVGTVRSYLSRARDLLRGRLTRRGLAPAGLIGAAWIQTVARAEVPAALTTATGVAAINGTSDAAVTTLVKVMLRSLLMARVKAATVAVGLVLTMASVGLVLRGAPASEQPDPAPVAKGRIQPATVDSPAESLPRHARSRLGIAGFHHGSGVNQVLYSRDGKSLVTIDWKRVVGVWDAATGRLAHELVLSGDLFDRIALSPDGRTIATTEPAPDRRLRLWDLSTARERRRWHVRKDMVCSSPTFSPDGRNLITYANEYDAATTQWKSIIELRDLSAPTEARQRIVGNWAGLGDFQIGPDGNTIAVMTGGPSENAIILMDLAKGREQARIQVQGFDFRSMVFTPDGKRLVTSITDGTIRAYDLPEGREHLPRLGQDATNRPGSSGAAAPAADRGPGVMNCLAFSPDGSILAGGWTANPRQTPAAGAIHLWNFDQGKELRRIGSFPRGVGWLSFSPDGRTLASAGSWEPVVRLWDVATGGEAFAQPGHLLGISTLAVSQSDGTVFTGSHDGTVRRWDPVSGRELGLIARLKSVQSMAVSPDGQTLIVGDQLGEPVLWSVADHREIRRLPRKSKNAPVRQVAFSPDGKTVAAQRTVWDVASGNVRVVLHAQDEPKDFAGNQSTLFYSSDSRRLITVELGLARVWDIASGEEVCPPVRSDKIPVHRAALSPEGRFLATGGSFTDPPGVGPLDTTIRIWDLPAGREVATLPGHDDAISGLAFSPDGRLLASHSSDRSSRRYVLESEPRDRTIRVWDIATRRELRRFEGHRGAINVITFTPDGRSLISGSDDATALVWDVSDLRDDRTTPKHP